MFPEQKPGHRARARALPPEVVLGHRHLPEQAFISALTFSEKITYQHWDHFDQILGEDMFYYRPGRWGV